ncbi:SH2 domain-containing protein 6-like [Tiliqua scincoides]|uniref:SH2 domain-containing protein 6-like n=1 Tax=Tiliqua scincoides TaxID=71010 RepID=UPI0034619AD2
MTGSCLPEKLVHYTDCAHGGTAEEDEEEDQYTYEVPPSEGQPKKVAPAQRQDHAEDVYLDRPSLRRPSDPTNLLQPPKPLKFLSKLRADDGHSEEGFKFAALEEVLKKGMTKPPHLPPPPPLSARRILSLPQRMTSIDPLQGTPLSKPGTSSPSCKAIQGVNGEGGPEEEMALTNLLPEATDLVGLVDVPALDSSMQNKAWYAGRCDRHTAEAALLRFNKDSAYMVRQSSGHGWNQPFTLAVLYKNHVYNIPIRYLESSHQYTLGKDGKNHEELFDSVSSIIQNYTERSLVLINGSTSAKEQTCLLFPVKP